MCETDTQHCVMPDPFERLGLPPDASPDEVRAARRRIARAEHPDAGGDERRMQEVNAAAADALRIIAEQRSSGRESNAAGSQTPGSRPDGSGTPGASMSGPDGFVDDAPTRRDAPSFTIEALPVEAFEALLVACAELGEVADDDPPYQLQARLGAPIGCWCQLDVVPDAGASTISVAIAPLDGERLPPILAVRDAWIDALNGLDWSSL